ncbi:MAG: family 3 adenylate cyclase [Rhizobium sp.]|nr:family 3 adenylate cyclase [Rhizobium sp.]
MAGAADGLLLQDMLPVGIAEELKLKGFVEPVFFPDTAVIFTDFEHFTESAALLTPSEVVDLLHTYFTEFDSIVARHGLEKIKTIGDSYMAVAGVPTPHISPYRAACDAALEIAASSRRISGPDGWDIRIGIHAGPLVAGVIGKHKYSYDVWGSTVNMASRMESSGIPGKINVSADLRAKVETDYDWEYRGFNPVKGLGLAEMYILVGKNALRDAAAAE